MDLSGGVSRTEKVVRRPADVVEPDLLKLGNHLVIKFHVLMKISQIYDSRNVALHQFVQESLQTINGLISRSGGFSLKIVRDELFLNDQRLRYSVDGFTSFKYLLTQWKKRLIGEVIFRGPLDEGTLKEFVYVLNNLDEGRAENAALLSDRLLAKGVSVIEVHPLEILENEDEAETLVKESQQEVGKKVFFETVGTIKDVIHQIKGGEYADVRKLKRLAQKAVYLVMEDESILLGLTTIKNYDEYTFNHSVNVSIYSMAVGKRLGFPRKTLAELGITAMLHDVGKSKIPKEVLNKPGALNDEEWGMMKKHPLSGVEIMLNLKQLGEIDPAMVIGVFDHHLKNDLSGYPKLFRKKRVSLFGRIIQIADAYDAMTTPRIYKKNPFMPEQALAVMLKEKVVHFDPLLLKVFIGLVGVYPIGSLVLLNTREAGVVFKPNSDPQWMDRPQVILLARDRKGFPKKEIVHLTETDEMGRFKRSIVKSMDPNKFHIDIGKYFL
jgi:HD-GYP domain-containing protein (c-di-GMP phosphodiesterase class II)